MFDRRSALAGLSGLAVLGLTACTTGAAHDAPDKIRTATATPSPNPASAGLEVVCLGTQGGPPIESDRAGIATALRVDDSLYLIDCGRGSATQFAKADLKLGSLKGIFVTHLHADHVADYYNFFLLAGSAPNSKRDNLSGPLNVYGPGSAGDLPPKFGGGEAATVSPGDPTPGIGALTAKCHEAFAYSHNLFLRDSGIRDVRDLAVVHEIIVPDVGSNFQQPSPAMDPFLVMEDDKVKVTATLVTHGVCYPAFAFRFDTEYGSVTFSGDTTYSKNLSILASGSDILVHEAINVRGAKNVSPALLDHILESHVEVQEVGPIAERAGVPKLVLSHIADLTTSPLDVTAWKAWAQNGYNGEVIIAEDLQRVSL